MRVKKETDKSWLNINSTFRKLTSWHLVPSIHWQIVGENVETETDFIFLGSKIIADGDCSHEVKTFSPWKKSYDKLRQHIKKAETLL